MFKNEKKVKKSKAVIIWAIVSALLVSVLGAGNVLAYGELSGLADTLFGGQRPIYNTDVVSMYPAEATSKEEAFNNAQALNLKVAEEGFVLLKNEANALPLERGAKISMFSKNSANLSYGGSGSGGFDTSKNQDLYSSLENAGFSANPTLKVFYEGSQSGSARSAQLQRSGQRQQPAHRHS